MYFGNNFRSQSNLDFNQYSFPISGGISMHILSLIFELAGFVSLAVGLPSYTRQHCTITYNRMGGLGGCDRSPVGLAACAPSPAGKRMLRAERGLVWGLSAILHPWITERAQFRYKCACAVPKRSLRVLKTRDKFCGKRIPNDLLNLREHIVGKFMGAKIFEFEFEFRKYKHKYRIFASSQNFA